MRIIGKTKDYYDGVKAYGVDPTCIYVRKREEVKIEDIKLFDIESVFYPYDLYGKKLFPYGSGNRGIGDGLHWKLYVIGFCGRLYTCYKLEYQKILDTPTYETKTFVKCVYNTLGVIAFLKIHGLKDELKGFLNKKGSRYTHFTEKNFNDTINMINGKEQDVELLFHLDRIPVFVIDISERKLIWNEVLKDFQFYKVVDTFTAFQELAGYVSGVLGGQSPKMIDIADRDMVYKKGFNDRSFRKDPGQKKRRKKRAQQD